MFRYLDLQHSNVDHDHFQFIADSPFDTVCIIFSFIIIIVIFFLHIVA